MIEGERQLEFPAFEGSAKFATPCTQEVCDGHGWTSTEAVSGLGFRAVVGGCGQEGWDGRKDGTQVSLAGCAPEHPETATHLSHAERPASGTMAAGPSTARSGAPPTGQDAVRLAPERVSRAAYPEPPPHVRATRPAVAGHGRTSAHSNVQPGASRRRLGGLGFHQHELPGSHHPRKTIRASGVSLRAHVLELGIGDPLRVGVVRGVVRRPPERAVGTGRSARAASQRQPERGGQQPVGQTRVSKPLSGAVGALRPRGRADQRPPTARERRQRVVSWAFQDRPGPSLASAWRPRFRQP